MVSNFIDIIRYFILNIDEYFSFIIELADTIAAVLNQHIKDLWSTSLPVELSDEPQLLNFETLRSHFFLRCSSVGVHYVL